jgi:hypothetical protein
MYGDLVVIFVLAVAATETAEALRAEVAVGVTARRALTAYVFL